MTGPYDDPKFIASEAGQAWLAEQNRERDRARRQPLNSTYVIAHLKADRAEDAQDIAKRRAKDDGFRVVTVRRVHLGSSGRWTVELAVRRP